MIKIRIRVRVSVGVTFNVEPALFAFSKTAHGKELG